RSGQHRVLAEGRERGPAGAVPGGAERGRPSTSPRCPPARWAARWARCRRSSPPRSPRRTTSWRAYRKPTAAWSLAGGRGREGRGAGPPGRCLRRLPGPHRQPQGGGQVLQRPHAAAGRLPKTKYRTSVSLVRLRRRSSSRTSPRRPPAPRPGPPRARRNTTPDAVAEPSVVKKEAPPRPPPPAAAQPAALPYPSQPQGMPLPYGAPAAPYPYYAPVPAMYNPYATLPYPHHARMPQQQYQPYQYPPPQQPYQAPPPGYNPYPQQ
uniref:Uncharacterized protein n=1 Tax=Bombyx mori TaxID=7091 RepID=A0A8R2M920_BOMMO